ncbi:DUF6370 family protein [Olleya aquimaris]|uniref:Uncharacterized protein n=1 Tax=Olleya aquimaris TaxID=639310 RepID=A0A327RDE0_9FLAO|nr:DUF6370 family protein [Olleya aquimaris]RAJ14980.1 hypothetical protein LY08_01328 [Olleya aquimaris]
MKNTTLILVILLFLSCNNKEKTKVVEMSCGQCQFGLNTQDGCDLAVRLNDKAYFVDGADIDDYGDAHDEHTGFCEVIRKAEVTGKVEGDRFKVTSVKMLD